MDKEQKMNALSIAIMSFNNYILNADHSQPATLNLIIDDELSENEIEYIETLVKDFENFEVFNNEDEELILTTDQLILMKFDLENCLLYLDTEVDRDAADEAKNDNNLFSKDF
ncbi:hypothetical protein OX284_005035 [Flavobacterium sp. SUN046]|uniref:hypothetical protein n=1 Tax=Flavobacterium sp. SUN046 TaxID=3002440 RepID=UPI002DBC7CD1|nr:hypothetical protein [Flavobacterium sp. SUN046]MEC4048786.1 hypothetical protein [Flavobacterium sp. SUN046]